MLALTMRRWPECRGQTVVNVGMTRPSPFRLHRIGAAVGVGHDQVMHIQHRRIQQGLFGHRDQHILLRGLRSSRPCAGVVF
jgi:hypothetical protein